MGNQAAQLPGPLREGPGQAEAPGGRTSSPCRPDSEGVVSIASGPNLSNLGSVVTQQLAGGGEITGR